MSAELAARRTAAAAALGDFRRAADAFIDDPTRTVPRPDYSLWAFRLASELLSILQRLETEAAEATSAPTARIDRSACLASSCPPPKLTECQWPKCVPPAPTRPGVDLAAGRLAEVRGVLEAFDWERDDRQYALEQIEAIVNGDPS